MTVHLNERLILLKSNPKECIKVSERPDICGKNIFWTDSSLVGSHLGNIPEKSESHWPKGLGGDSI